MSKAEEAAYKAYPYNGDYRGQGDSNSEKREACINGYHQAEKDLELTWEDMRELHLIFEELDVDINLCKTNIKIETLGYYQEVLKRFKSEKGE